MSLKGVPEDLGLSKELNYPGKIVLTCEDNNFLQDEDYAGLPKCITRHPIKCDRTIQVPPKINYFNYKRFALFLQLQKQNERLQRFRSICNGDSLKSVDEFRTDDEIFVTEFCQIYGEVDCNSTKFSKLLENYKRDRISELQEWEREERELKKPCNRNILNKLVLSEEMDLTAIFSPDELKVFRKLDENPFAPFNLPKKPALSNKKVDLTKYDPALHLPSYISPDISEAEIGEKLIEKFDRIVSMHPHGITSVSFLMKFDEKFGYLPNHEQIGYSSFQEMMHDLSYHLIHIDSSKRDFFMFPICLKGCIVSVRDMLHEIWHKIRICLYFYSGICRVDVLLKCMSQCFGYTLHLNDWGFSTDEEFVIFLCKTWPIHGFQIVCENDILDSGSDDKMYLVDCKGEEQRALLKRMGIITMDPKVPEAKRGTQNELIKSESVKPKIIPNSKPKCKTWNSLF